MLWQPSLHERYTKASQADLARDIAARRQELGDRLVILGHHYQTDAVIRHADLTGDSLKLSQMAADVVNERPVENIIFCGVHFMAETADILTPDSVAVSLPDLSAGCSMADMAQEDDCIEAWDEIHAVLDTQGFTGRVIPITYVNSSAAIKAFVGAHGGACCTSSNADRVFAWAAEGGDTPRAEGEEIKILFLPDQHLGRNTAHDFGVDVAKHAHLYDPKLTRKGRPLGGMTDEQLRDARVILWAGHCSVHKLFRPEHVDEIRAMSAATPDRSPWNVIVHPECAKEVVDLADLSGSTEFILRAIEDAEPGSRWAVGTEHNLVNRLRQQAAERGVEVRILSDCQCLCTTMYRIDEPHLLWTLDMLCGISPSGKRREPETPNVIRVAAGVREQSTLALNRMLRLAPSANASPAAADA
ncbi:MAG: quinolinate synthase NadA [Planctomycetota bacterium]